MIQRTNGGRKKLTSPGIPEVPEIDPAWIEALKNSKPVAPTAKVSPYKYTSVRQANDDIMRKYFEKYPVAKEYADENNGRLVANPQNLKTGGDKYGAYDAGKWGGLYGKLTDTARILDATVGEAIKSGWRTASGQNLNTTFNPNSGAGAAERIGAFGEDVLNVASIVPGVRTLADASVPLEQGIRNWLFSKSAAGKQQLADELERAAAFKSSYKLENMYSPKVTKYNMMEGDIAAEQSVMQQQLKTDNYFRPEWKKYQPWEENYDPNILRVWHTNPDGSQLPPKLYSMEDSARIAERRGGSGAAQLFSGGLYQTDNAAISHTYFTNPTEYLNFPHHNISDNYLKNMLQLPTRNNIVGFTDDARSMLAPWDMDRNQINDMITKMQYDDYMSNVIGIDDPVGDYLLGGFKADPNLSLRQILNNAASAEEAQQIVNSLIYPVKVTSKSVSVPERIRFKYPVFTNDGKTWKNMATATSADSAYIAGEAARNGTYGSGVDQNRWSKGLQEKLKKLANDWELERVRLFKEKYPDYEPSFTINPFEDALRDMSITTNRPKWQAVPGTHMGGQNYWDMPITRGPAGDITSAYGLPTMDITNITPQNAKKLGSYVREFIDTYIPNVSPQLVDGLVRQVEEMPSYTYGSTKAFDIIQKQVDGMVADEGIQSFGGLTGKEKLWMFLRDKGINVLPHEGGTLGGVGHQAVVVNSPELLPPSKYLPSTFDRYGQMSEEITQVRNAKLNELAHLYAMKMNPNIGSEVMKQQQLNEIMNKARLAGVSGIKSMLVGSANNAARNR